MKTVHIIGAGLAGLSTGVRLAEKHVRVCIYEASGQAGGRCRSYVDKSLGTLIDNGNHLVLSGNRSALAYLDLIGSRASMIEPPRAVFPFFDVEQESGWILRPSGGPIPFWLADPRRRVPDTLLTDYGEGLKLALAGKSKTVSQVLKTSGTLYQRFWEPLVLAALNTTADDGAACLLWAVLKETFLKGEEACRPLVAREGLGPSFIDPALRYLEQHGAEFTFARRLTGLVFGADRVTALDFHNGREVLGPEDQVVLALPPARAGQVLPDLDPPGESGIIVNAHYQMDGPITGMDDMPFMGLINSPVHWIFVRRNIISLTISAAGDLADEPAEKLIPMLWTDTAIALDLGAKRYTQARIVKEKRATFDQSPEGIAKRRGPRTNYANLFLAGDWTRTGLPATIESAIRSGENASRLILSGK